MQEVYLQEFRILKKRERYHDGRCFEKSVNVMDDIGEPTWTYLRRLFEKYLHRSIARECKIFQSRGCKKFCVNE